MSTAPKHQPDGTYTLGDYLVRKTDESDAYEVGWGLAVKKVIPKGWMVEHTLFAHPEPVTNLRQAEELIERHAHGFWWTRCEDFAAAIDVGHSDSSVAAITHFVEGNVRMFGITTADFWELDERPGQFTINGRSYTKCEWHRNLRVTRNASDTLFDLLAANSRRPL